MQIFTTYSMKPSNHLIYCGGIFDYDNAVLRRDELNSLTSATDLWNDQERAQKLMSEKNTLEAKLSQYENFISTVSEYKEMAEFAEAENDEAMQNELLQNYHLYLSIHAFCSSGFLSFHIYHIMNIYPYYSIHK